MTISRRQFVGSLGAVAAAGVPRPSHALGDTAEFTMSTVIYDSPGYNLRPSAIRRLQMEIEMTTSILVGTDSPEVTPTLEALFTSPIACVSGDRGFTAWSDDARRAMSTYLSAGGTVLVDSSEGIEGGTFDESVRAEIAEWVPGASLTAIPTDHVVYKSFYLVDSPAGRLAVSPVLEGVEIDGRLAVIYSQNDLLGAWARDNFGNFEFSVFPGGETQRSMAYRLGVNLAMYSLCLDYKADQVHVPFILQRRRWRVP